MDLSQLHILLGAAVLLPLISFAVIVLAGPKLGKAGELAGYVATGMIVTSFLLSLASFAIWVSNHPPQASGHHVAHAEDHTGEDVASEQSDEAGQSHDEDVVHEAGQGIAVEHDGERDELHGPVKAITGDWYSLGEFGQLRLTIGYYIDALTVCMFCMVTLIASCIHFYAMGYMHEELHDVTDHEVTLEDGSHLHRPGRYHRFFQYMSLFCFSMLGLVVSGNVAMTFVFWELVGICSYFLIGFYVERHSASTAANKAFIVNRVGDFGMIIGLMALWGSLGTFDFGDLDGDRGIFSQVRPGDSHELVTPIGMVRAALPQTVAQEVRDVRARMPDASHEEVEAELNAAAADWREASDPSPGYWLLIVAGVGIFCGCVGKSAQFPLHVWLPDAMEGPTPVSALVHSATMVAAGVFLVARFYPVFTPEVLFVIALTGTITLFMAATIAITATDIKRVLAYSTVSQLGYMMLALGVGGWLAGVMHLITHAFFKSLLFLCSGSVIHAVHTNEMPQMGGLRKKMPWTAYTMLVGCLAIAGAGIPFLIGFSGYYSKDAILEQALSFRNANGTWGAVFFFAAAGGAAITAFYMFRLWYMTFAGEPRDRERYDHAHESPPVMFVPLVVLAIFAVGVAWKPVGESGLGWLSNEAVLGAGLSVAVLAVLRLVYGKREADSLASGTGGHGHHEHHDADTTRPLNIALVLSMLVLAVAVLWSLPGTRNIVLSNLLEQARPAGTLPTETSQLMQMTWPDEHLSHEPEVKVPATMIAFSTALGGFLLATVFYGWRILDAQDVRSQFPRAYRFLLNKWWFDELYDLVFIRPTHYISALAAGFDRRCIDWVVDGSASVTRVFSNTWERIADRYIVDGFVNWLADWTYLTALSLRTPETGRLRQYVMFIVAGTVVAFVLVSFVWSVYAR